MTRTSACLWALLGCSSLLAQEKKDPPSDKIGKDKAPVVARKAIAETQKRKGAAISETGEVSAGGIGNPKVTGSFDGILRKDFAAVKGTLEIYAQGTKTLVNTGARFDAPDEIDGQPQLQAATFRNPALLLAEVSKLVASAQFLSEETIDGKECRELTFVADEATLKQYLKDVGDRLAKQFKALAGGFGGALNASGMMDEKASVATYSVLVSKEDLLVRRLTFVLKPKINPKSLPPQVPPQFSQMALDQRFEVKFSKWDEDLPVEIPGAIKAKWGIK
jgi:hypothetical protein